MRELVLDVRDRPKLLRLLALSLQHVCAMFGATVLVPMLTGMDPSVALVASGVGTLIYILCTKAKVPVYLGSSFAYIQAICLASTTVSPEAPYVALMVVGIIYVIVSFIIRFTGKGWLEKLLPPIIVGPMIAVIGLSLASTAIDQTGLSGGSLADNWKSILVAIITFSVTVVCSIKGKGFIKIIPFLIGISTGYISSVIIHFITGDFMDFSPFANTGFFHIPDFTFIGTYDFNFGAVVMFIPIAFVTICEHIGDHKVLGSVTDKDFIKDPGLDKTLLGDGLATLFSAMIGGPANTTYGENTGVVSMTRVASVWVTGAAAIIAIILGFFGYVQAFIQTIPTAVMGGISVVLFGLIASNGLKVIVDAKVDLYKTRNIIIIASMLIVGLGGAVISLGNAATLEKMSLAVLVGVILNLLLPKETENTDNVVLKEVDNDESIIG